MKHGAEIHVDTVFKEKHPAAKPEGGADIIPLLKHAHRPPESQNVFVLIFETPVFENFVTRHCPSSSQGLLLVWKFDLKTSFLSVPDRFIYLNCHKNL